MPRPVPITTTDELLVELVDQVAGLHDLLRDRLAAPPVPQDPDGTVELREPETTPPAATTPPRRPDPADPGPAAHPPAKAGAAKKTTQARNVAARKHATSPEGRKP